MALEDLVRSVTRGPVTRIVRRHLDDIAGLENLPLDEAFVLAPNHRSYFDHFVVQIVVGAVTGRPVWFLTKRESFERALPRIWARSWFGVPVDRGAPSPGVLKHVREVLDAGDALCVYPEGTRNEGEGLLPFLPGAFRFASSSDVAVVPVAITGTTDVLRRGDRWFRRGGHVRIAFGAPRRREPGSGSRAAAELLAEGTRRDVEDLLDALHRRPERDVEGAGIADAADHIVSRALDEQGRLPLHEVRRLATFLALLAATDRGRRAARSQSARVIGLLALRLPKSLRIVPALLVRHLVQGVLAQEPADRTANYLAGRWHLAVPRRLGGSSSEAVRAFERSAVASESGDLRALSGLVDALRAAGDREASQEVLRRMAAVERPLTAHDRRRRDRARELCDARPAPAASVLASPRERA